MATLVVVAMVASPRVAAQEDPPLTWFNYFFDSTTTLAYGVLDSDYTPLFLECERANPVTTFHIEHEPVRVRDGENTDVRVSGGGIEVLLSGTALYQVMDDLMRIQAPMAVDDSLARMLAADGPLTITIEGKTAEYPLTGITEPAARLLEACLAASPDDPPAATMDAPGLPAPGAPDAPLALQAVAEVDLTPIARARPDLVEGNALRISAIQASPDGSLLAVLLPSRDIDFPDQAWLYRRADGQSVPATPRPASTPPPYPDGTPAAIKALAWQGDTLYARIAIWTREGEGEERNTEVYATTPGESRRLDEVPDDIHAMLDDAAEPGVVGQDEVPESDWALLGVMESNAQVLVWPYEAGDGTFELRWRPRLAGSPVHVAARGGPELSQYVFDRHHSRLLYPGASGIRMLDMDSRSEQAIAGTQPGDVPLAVSDDGRVFVWSTRHSCAEGRPAPPDNAQPDARYYCVAQFQTGAVPGPAPVSPVHGADASMTDPWPGAWSANHVGRTSAKIRRGTAKPEYLVIDLVTGMPGCSGAVTLYGQPEGRRVHTYSYDAKDPRAPVCAVTLTLDPQDVLRVEETGDCGYFRGGSCVFDSELMRDDRD